MTALQTQLSWNYRELLSIPYFEKIKYYIDISIKQNLSYRELHNKIKNNEYDKTIGIIIVNKDNMFILEYSNDERIYENTYILKFFLFGGEMI